MVISEKGGKEQTFAFTYPALAPALKKDFPEIAEVVRFRRQGGIVTQGEQKISEDGNLYYAEVRRDTNRAGEIAPQSCG